MKWKAFEKEVAELFSFFGYETTHDTKVSAGQTDVLATSPRRNRPNLMIECKFHNTQKDKVGITEVQKFSARVTTARMNGLIDHGYLVTNTGFTADARASLQGQPQEKYVFLVTYEELLQTLLDAHNYLKDFIQNYELQEHQKRYVSLYVIETTWILNTLFEVVPCDQIELSTEASRKGKKLESLAIVLNSKDVKRLIDSGIATEQLDTHRLVLNKEKVLIEAYKSYERKHTRCQDRYEQLCEAIRGLRSEITEEIAVRLGFESVARCRVALEKDPISFLGHLRYHPEMDMRWALAAMPRRRRWDRDLMRHVIREYERLAEKPNATHEYEDLMGPIGPVLASAIDPKYPFKDKLAKKVPQREVMLLALSEALTDLKGFVESGNCNLYVILGDYGAGKTTVLNRFMYDLAKKKLQSQYDACVRIPLLINLRDYNKVPDFDQMVRSFVVDQAEMGDINLRLFKRLNDGGRFVLLLDGFDEMLARVTKPDRRRCFLEIAEFVGPNSKVIVTGRPGYFPDHAEFAEVVMAMQRKYSGVGSMRKIDARVACLQLMDEAQAEELISKSGTEDIGLIKTIMRKQPGLSDLARRPVLASMIAQTASQLAQLGEEEITARRLYELYTDRWVQIEEDKGSFRVLIDPIKKSTFIRYLAMQMHLSGSLSILYTELDRRIASYFGLDSAEEMDHFSHDVRTASFLRRTDRGEYRFIHKSFMEYFVAREFEQMESSPFAEDFNKPLTDEIVAFLDFEKLPPEYSQVCPFRDKIEPCIERLQRAKDEAVTNADYAVAAAIRDVAQALLELRTNSDRIFSSMKRLCLTEELEKLKKSIVDSASGCGSKKEARKILKIVRRDLKGLIKDWPD